MFFLKFRIKIQIVRSPNKPDATLAETPVFHFLQSIPSAFNCWCFQLTSTQFAVDNSK